MEPKRKRPNGACALPPCSTEAPDPASHVHLLLAHVQPVIPSQYLAPTIYAFLDRSKGWTLETASAANAAVLLDRIAAREWPGVNHALRRMRFLFNIEVAAKKGYVDVLHWWRTRYLANDKPSVTKEIFRIAAYEGHLHVIEWLCETDGPLDPVGRWEPALVASHPEIVRWVHKHWQDVQMTVLLENIAARGDLKFLKWLRSKTTYSYTVRDTTVAAAVEAGHLDMLQYLFAMEPRINPYAVFKKASYNGHLHIVQWLFSEDEELEEKIEDAWDCVEESHFGIIKWLTEQYPWKDNSSKETWIMNTIGRVASSGDMEMLRYLYARLPADEEIYILDHAVFSGNVEMAKWLHALGVEPGTQDLISTSVRSTKLEMVKWVHETYPGTRTMTDTMDRAAETNLDIVKFLHENRSEGCTSEAMTGAATFGFIDIVEFLDENRSEGNVNEAINRAAGRGYLDVVKFLHDRHPKINTSKALKSAAHCGHLEIVQLLVEISASEFDTTKAILAAASNGHRDVVTYLGLLGNADFDGFQVESAVHHGHFHLLEWMMETGVPQVKHIVSSMYGRSCANWRARILKLGSEQ